MRLYNEDCFQTFARLDPGSIDFVCVDPPYGTTKAKWDSVIPLAPMWEQLSRITKPNAAIAVCCNEPFTSVLITSNLKHFRYKYIWEKTAPTGHLNANKMPLKWYEEIAIFYRSLPTFNPQYRTGPGFKKTMSGKESELWGKQKRWASENDGTTYRPKDILTFPKDNRRGKVHPTQKPVALMEYLIKTYTNEGETVLDFCMGSGSTGVAALDTNREFIGVEKEPGYFQLAQDRLGVNLNPPVLSVRNPEL